MAIDRKDVKPGLQYLDNGCVGVVKSIVGADDHWSSEHVHTASAWDTMEAVLGAIQVFGPVTREQLQIGLKYCHKEGRVYEVSQICKNGCAINSGGHIHTNTGQFCFFPSLFNPLVTWLAEACKQEEEPKEEKMDHIDKELDRIYALIKAKCTEAGQADTSTPTLVADAKKPFREFLQGSFDMGKLQKASKDLCHLAGSPQRSDWDVQTLPAWMSATLGLCQGELIKLRESLLQKPEAKAGSIKSFFEGLGEDTKDVMIGGFYLGTVKIAQEEAAPVIRAFLKAVLRGEGSKKILKLFDKVVGSELGQHIIPLLLSLIVPLLVPGKFKEHARKGAKLLQEQVVASGFVWSAKRAKAGIKAATIELGKKPELLAAFGVSELNP